MVSTTINSVGAKLKFKKTMFGSDGDKIPAGAVYKVIETESVKKYPYTDDSDWVKTTELTLELIDNNGESVELGKLCKKTTIRYPKIDGHVELLN